MVVALIRPSLMTKWRVGTTPLSPRPTNTPENKRRLKMSKPSLHWQKNRGGICPTCSDSSVLRRGEEVALGDSDGGQSQYAYHNQVDEAGLRRAVEGVVQPGDEGAHDQKGDPAVVQPAQTERVMPSAAFLKCYIQTGTPQQLTWRRLWRRLQSGSKLCGTARRRTGRGWLPGKTPRSPPSPEPEPRTTCWAWTCTWDPDRGKRGSLQEEITQYYYHLIRQEIHFHRVSTRFSAVRRFQR